MPAAVAEGAVRQARQKLDDQVAETIAWHFHETTGCPFWLNKRKELKFDPLKEVKCFDDLKKFPEFEDEWLRGGQTSCNGPSMSR